MRLSEARVILAPVEQNVQVAVALESSSVNERRNRLRFPISAPLIYSLRNTGGTGVTKNISSGGVLIDIDRVLPVGRRIKLLIDWTATLEDGCLMRLQVLGRVIRSDSQGTAVAIIKHEFRTRAKNAVAEPNLANSRISAKREEISRTPETTRIPAA